MGKEIKKNLEKETEPKQSTNDIVIKESPDDVLMSGLGQGELKEEIKKEAERSDVLSRFLIPLFTFILIVIGTAVATWYYAKPERTKGPTQEEKIQTPPKVEENIPTTPTPTTTPTPASAATDTRVESYVVKEGDTLSSIANAYGMTSTELASYNGITNPESLSIGQTLKIPVK